jgi:phage baseplate assembly protein V
MVRTVQKLMAPLARRISMLLGRGVVKLINDAGGRQLLQVSILADEVRAEVERFQNYGITSFPFEGAEVVTASVGGSRDHTIVLVVDDRRYRLQGLEQGEVALYDDQGQKIHLKRNKEIEITGCDTLKATCTVSATVTAPQLTIIATTKVTMTTPRLEVSGDIIATGNVADAGGTKTMAAMRTTFNTHHHSTGPAPTEQM